MARRVVQCVLKCGPRLQTDQAISASVSHNLCKSAGADVALRDENDNTLLSWVVRNGWTGFFLAQASRVLLKS